LKCGHSRANAHQACPVGALNSSTMIVGAPKHFNAHIFSTPAHQMDANGGEADALPTRAISRVLTIFFWRRLRFASCRLR
jgi:hypothetical protein